MGMDGVYNPKIGLYVMKHKGTGIESHYPTSPHKSHVTKKPSNKLSGNEILKRLTEMSV